MQGDALQDMQSFYSGEAKLFLELNEALAQVWPQICDQKDPLPDAKKWDGVAGKLEHLQK